MTKRKINKCVSKDDIVIFLPNDCDNNLHNKKYTNKRNKKNKSSVITTEIIQNDNNNIKNDDTNVKNDRHVIIALQEESKRTM